MSDSEPMHADDEADRNEDAVEDLAPTGDGEDVAGGALNAYLTVKGQQQGQIGDGSSTGH